MREGVEGYLLQSLARSGARGGNGEDVGERKGQRTGIGRLSDGDNLLNAI